MAYYKKATWDTSPTNGSTVVIPPFDDAIMCVFVDPVTNLGSLTIQLPDGAIHGQAVRIFLSKSTTTTVVGGLAAVVAGVLGLLTGPSSFVYAYNANTNSWWKG